MAVLEKRVRHSEPEVGLYSRNSVVHDLPHRCTAEYPVSTSHVSHIEASRLLKNTSPMGQNRQNNPRRNSTNFGLLCAAVEILNVRAPSTNQRLRRHYSLLYRENRTNCSQSFSYIHHVYTIDSGAILFNHRNNRSLLSVLESLRDIGKSTSRAEISSPSSLFFKAVKGAHIGSALFV